MGNIAPFLVNGTNGKQAEGMAGALLDKEMLMIIVINEIGFARQVADDVIFNPRQERICDFLISIRE